MMIYNFNKTTKGRILLYLGALLCIISPQEAGKICIHTKKYFDGSSTESEINTICNTFHNKFKNDILFFTPLAVSIYLATKNINSIVDSIAYFLVFVAISFTVDFSAFTNIGRGHLGDIEDKFKECLVIIGLLMTTLCKTNSDTAMINITEYIPATLIVISLLSAITFIALITTKDNERQKTYSSTLKFIICTFTLTLITVELGHIIKIKEIETAQQKELYQLIPNVVGSTLETKIELANFFSELNLSKPIHEAWTKYRNSLLSQKKQIQLQKKSLAKEIKIQSATIQAYKETYANTQSASEKSKLAKKLTESENNYERMRKKLLKLQEEEVSQKIYESSLLERLDNLRKWLNSQPVNATAN